MGVFLPSVLPAASRGFSLLAAAPPLPSATADDATLYAAPKGPEQANPLPTLIGVVVESIVEVAILCAVGWYLAKRGIVDAKAKKTLNKINTSLFTPCLLFNKVAFSLTPDKLAELYIIPIGFVLVSAFSAGVAYVMGKLFRLKKGQRNFAIACATFQNSNSLPIALLQSLIGEKLPLAWGPHDTKDGMLGRGLSYLVLFSSLGIIVRWSIGVRLLSSAEAVTETGAVSNGPDAEAAAADVVVAEPDSAASTREDDQVEREQDGLLPAAGAAAAPKGKRASILKTHSPNGAATSASSSPTSRTRESSTASTTGVTLIAEDADDDQDPNADEVAEAGKNGRGDGAQNGKGKRRRVFQSFPNTPIPSVYSSSTLGDRAYDDEEDEDEEDGEEDTAEDAEWGHERGFGRPSSVPVWFKRLRRGAGRAGRKVKRFAKQVGEFMTVPLWAAVLSLVVACIPPLQRVLNEAEPLKSAIRSAGSCSVPITLVTLGAYFYSPSAASAADTSPLRREEQELPPRGWRKVAHVVKKPFVSTATALNGLASGRGVGAADAAAAGDGAEVDETALLKRRTRRSENLTIFVAVVARMIVVPVVLIPLFAYYAKVTINVADDPIFVVVACLLIGSPTAITLAQITSSAAGPTFERLISRTLFVSYAFLTAPSTILLVLAALWIDGLQHPHTNGPGQGHEHLLVFGPGAMAAGNVTFGGY